MHRLVRIHARLFDLLCQRKFARVVGGNRFDPRIGIEHQGLTKASAVHCQHDCVLAGRGPDTFRRTLLAPAKSGGRLVMQIPDKAMLARRGAQRNRSFNPFRRDLAFGGIRRRRFVGT